MLSLPPCQLKLVPVAQQVNVIRQCRALVLCGLEQLLSLLRPPSCEGLMECLAALPQAAHVPLDVEELVDVAMLTVRAMLEA